MSAPHPSAYRHIRAWGNALNSYEYFIVGEQAAAFEAGVALDAIYRSDGEWHFASELSPEARENLEAHIIRRPPDRPLSTPPH